MLLTAVGQGGGKSAVLLVQRDVHVLVAGNVHRALLRLSDNGQNHVATAGQGLLVGGDGDGGGGLGDLHGQVAGHVVIVVLRGLVVNGVLASVGVGGVRLAVVLPVLGIGHSRTLRRHRDGVGLTVIGAVVGLRGHDEVGFVDGQGHGRGYFRAADGDLQVIGPGVDRLDLGSILDIGHRQLVRLPTITVGYIDSLGLAVIDQVLGQGQGGGAEHVAAVVAGFGDDIAGGGVGLGVVVLALHPIGVVRLIIGRIRHFVARIISFFIPAVKNAVDLAYCRQFALFTVQDFRALTGSRISTGMPACALVF